MARGIERKMNKQQKQIKRETDIKADRKSWKERERHRKSEGRDTYRQRQTDWERGNGGSEGSLDIVTA